MQSQSFVSRTPRYSRHLYAALMCAYPPDFRARFGGEMMQVFEDSHSSANAAHNLFSLWSRTLRDFAVSFPNLWWQELREADDSEQPSWMISIPVFVLATGVLLAEGWVAASLGQRLGVALLPGDAAVLFRISLETTCGLTMLSGALAAVLARREQIDLVILNCSAAAAQTTRATASL